MSADENKPLLHHGRTSYSSVQQDDSHEGHGEARPSSHLSPFAVVRAFFSRFRRPPGHRSEGTSWYLSVFLVVNAALGSAFLNFPRAFDQAGGVVAALSVQSVLLLIASATLIILAYSSDASKATTYQDVILGVLGPRYGIISCLTIVVYCFGTCITFLIIIGDQWDRFFFSYTGDPLFCHKFYFHRRFTIVVSSLIFILPFCYPKRIDFLKYAAAAGVLANVYLDFLQVYKYYTGEYAGKAGPIKTAPDNWTDLFLVAPTIFFGYQCHVSSVPIYACLEKRTVTEFLKTVLTAMAVCAATYSVAATYGYWTFGSNVDADILSNYDANDPLVLAGLIAMAFKTYTTYPLIIFCGRTGVDSLAFLAWKRCRSGAGREEGEEEEEEENDEEALWERGEKTRRIVLVSVWFSVTLALSMIVPGIDFMIPVLGAFAAGFIVIFPGLCLLEVTLRRGEARSRDVEDAKGEEEAQRRLANVQNGGGEQRHVTFAPTHSSTSKRRDWVGYALLSMALFLLIFGAFMLGIIFTNSILNINGKAPLCQ